MTREELVPHIAKAIRPKWLGVPDRLISDIAGIVLEEAAKVAGDTKAYDDNLQKAAGCGTTGQRIAAAIRALGEKP